MVSADPATIGDFESEMKMKLMARPWRTILELLLLLDSHGFHQMAAVPYEPIL